MQTVNNYTYVKEYAEKLLDIALKYDELDKFLVAYPGYEVTVNDGMGNKKNSTDAIMRAIYKKYSVDSSISQKLYIAIESNIKETKNGITILQLLDIIKYQMREEKEKTAPFEIDCGTLLQIVRENIIENKHIYTNKFKTYTNGFMEEFQNYNQNLESNYGHKIL